MLTRLLSAGPYLVPPKFCTSATNLAKFWTPGSGSRHRIHLATVLAMAESAEKHRHVNRLASEHSPYLLQHALNPVDWFPWGQEAFDRAKERNIPIFLSIGYSTCHWCHVMEVESFENKEVADMLNKWFVSIKVDREERPDVDKVYMTYVQAVYGSGGWPLSVFLSPDLKPLMGGTYFPPDDKYGRPGFKTVLRRVKEAWDTKRDVLVKSGEYAIQELSEALSAKANVQGFSENLFRKVVETCATKLKQSYDADFGGFGSAPKFPRPVEIYLMLYYAKSLEESGKKNEAEKNLESALFSLRCMARGGIHDHVGGGFHRYSVDERWHVPHFEKMLYDQGQLANVYLDAFTITKDTFFSSMTRDILDYLKRDMVDEQGGIYSAEDADSAEFEGAARKKEGAFYIWSSKEVEEIVGTDVMKLFKDHYYIKPSGNCDLSRMSDPHQEFKGKNVLIEKEDVFRMASKVGMSVETYMNILGESREKLFNTRSMRPRPHLDDKVIVAWNGLAISSFVRASKILKLEPKDTEFYFPVTGCDPGEYMETAEKTLLFVRMKLYDENKRRLHHSFRNGPSNALGFLDDYAFLISALLDMYEYGGRTNWLTWAIELQASQDELFLDKVGGGYFNTQGQDPSVLLRVKEDHDGAEPSGNSVSATNLVRLSSLVSGELSSYYRKTAKHLLAVFESRLGDLPMAVPLMCCAADMISLPSRTQVVLVGRKLMKEFQEMVVAAHATYDPNRTIRVIMARAKPLVCVIHLGGSLVTDNDGLVSYTGGEAHLTDIDHDTTFERFKTEVAEMHGGDISGLTFKYSLPTNKRTLITISTDKDLKRMVDINRETVSPEIYALMKGSVPITPIKETRIIPSRASTTSIIESSTAVVCNGDRLNKLTVLWENSITGVGQLFKDAHEFREALRKYAIAKNFGYKFVQNDRRRVTAKCKSEGCLWRIHGSRVSTTKIIKVRVFKDVHTCDRNVDAQSSPHVTRFWIANAIKKQLEENPDYKVADIVKDIQRDYGLKLNYSQAWRGKETAREQLLGKDVDFYKQLPRYCQKLAQTNPGSIAILATTAEERFNRLFICFHACICGFIHGCRPLVLLDCTVLKSKYGGTLFIAASVDGNDEIFPIAFAVVGQEDHDSWHWFLEQLKTALPPSRPLTFVSDRNKGLEEAIPQVFENSEHAFCLRYLARHLKKEMKITYSKEVKDVLVELIFAAARSCRNDEFIACIESIKSVSDVAATWIMSIPPERWANLFFKGSRYNQMASNVIEFIDGWISKARDFPVLKLVEVMRCEIAELFRARLDDSSKWNSRLTPKAEEKLHKEMSRASLLSVSVSSASVFEVIDDHVNVVDLERWECTCLSWKLTGLPCRHVIASLNCIGRNAYDYCERYFTIEFYRQTYMESINPVFDIDSIGVAPNEEAVVDSYPNVELPKTRRLRGRPKKRWLESQEIGKRTLLCSKCKEPGHNKTTCKAYDLITN